MELIKLIEKIKQEKSESLGSVVGSPISISSGNNGVSVLFVSSWEVACGIAQYTSTLVDCIKSDHNISVLKNDAFIDYDLKRYEVIHIQYEPALYTYIDENDDPKDNRALLLEMLTEQTTPKIVATAHYADSWYTDILEGFLDLSIVHNPDIEIKNNRKYLVQGCPVFSEKDKVEVRNKYGLPLGSKILSSFGFIMYWKQIDHYFSFLAPVIQNDPNIFVQLLHAKHPSAEDLGEQVEANIRKNIKDYGIEDKVFVCFDFLSKEEINERLQATDLGFITGSAESKGSSASNKEFISARCPLVLNRCAHFSDLEKGVVFVSTNSDPKKYVNVLQKTLYNDSFLDQIKQEQRENYLDLNYRNFSGKHIELYNQILGRIR